MIAKPRNKGPKKLTPYERRKMLGRRYGKTKQTGRAITKFHVFGESED